MKSTILSLTYVAIAIFHWGKLWSEVKSERTKVPKENLLPPGSRLDLAYSQIHLALLYRSRVTLEVPVKKNLNCATTAHFVFRECPNVEQIKSVLNAFVDQGLEKVVVTAYFNPKSQTYHIHQNNSLKISISYEVKDVELEEGNKDKEVA